MSSYQKLKTPEGMQSIPPRWLIQLMMTLKVPAPAPEPLFVKPENWADLTPEERRRMRFDNWVEGNGINFSNAEVKSAYQKRAKLLRNALDLDSKPERVPVIPFAGVYPLVRVGLTPKALFYDQQREAALAHVKFFKDFEGDASVFGFCFSGNALEMLDYQVQHWPGAQLPAERSYQYVEHEFMKADEYPHLLSDPSDFMLRRAMPRMFKALKGLEKMPKFALSYYGNVLDWMSIASPEVQEALKIMQKAAELTMQAMVPMIATMTGPPTQGFPQLYGAATFAPLDALSDVLRSTRGVMMDMFRHPDELIAASELYASLLIDSSLFEISSSPLVFIPLHKGADTFMSPEQFEKFYWPSLKKVMLALVEDGFVPAPFAEGSYNHRLDTIADFPRNSCVWHFDQSDMKKASEVLNDVCPIMGNVPASLTATGTPEDMTNYCKDLIESVGSKGNFLLMNGCQIDEGKDENIKAMVESVKKFKV